jgi:hypothetical protein
MSIKKGYIICCYTMSEEQTAINKAELTINQKNFDSGLPDGRD